MTPTDIRIASAGKVGKFGVGGLADFRSFYSTEASASAYYDWRAKPETTKAIRALRDLATSHPSVTGLSTGDIAVQYGITLGLSLAANLLDDPALVVRGLFGEKPSMAMTPLAESFDEPTETIE